MSLKLYRLNLIMFNCRPLAFAKKSSYVVLFYFSISII